MLNKDVKALSLAYLSIPIALLVINSEASNGIFIHNQFIVNIGNFIYNVIMGLGFILPGILIIYLLISLCLSTFYIPFLPSPLCSGLFLK
jgi:hypothetical protein